MTAAFSRGKGRRATAALGTVTAGLLVLAGCDKPTPLATLSAGSDSVSTEATDGCYHEGGGSLSEKKTASCLSKKGSETLSVKPGEKLRVGVEPKIAKSGWVLVSEDPPMNEPSKETYRSFDADDLFQQRNQMGQVEGMRKTAKVAVVELGKGGSAKGMWHFTLRRDNS